MCISLIENRNEVNFTTVIKGDNIEPENAEFATTGNKKLSVLFAARSDLSKSASIGVKLTQK